MKYLTFFIVLFIVSCDIPYIENEWDNNNVSTFNYLSEQIRDHYVYTEFKGINIETLNDSYRSKIDNSMDKLEFFNILSSYINELKDGHSNLRTDFAYSSYYDSIIGMDTDEYNPNYNEYTLKHYYLDNSDISTDPAILAQYQLLGRSLINGIIVRDGKNYGYIYYSSFMNPISIEDIESIIKGFQALNVKGVILDLRNNGGGSLSNMVTLVSYFGAGEDSKSKKVARVWRRDSKNKYSEVDGLDLAPFTRLSFTVDQAKEHYSGKVALLTNRGSYSASSFTATAFKNYDNVKQFGTKTGGGMGLPVGGYLPNGWSYRLSGNVVLSADSRGIEDILDPTYNWEDGVPADIEVVDDQDTKNKDEIIDRAIEWIDSGV